MLLYYYQQEVEKEYLKPYFPAAPGYNRFQLPVNIWQRACTWTFKYNSTSKINKVVLDPKKNLPDTDKKNNEWNIRK